jgi:PEP-CTERM motif
MHSHCCFAVFLTSSLTSSLLGWPKLGRTDRPARINFKGGVSGTNRVFQIGDCIRVWCLDSVSFAPAKYPNGIDVPHGLNWLNLYSFVGNNSGHVIAWSNSNGTGGPSLTLIDNPITGISEYPSSLAFTVYGTPTVPEPGSMMLFGSGVLGLAGVLRRKLKR